MDAVVKRVAPIDPLPGVGRGNHAPTWAVMGESLIGQVIAGSRFALKNDLAALSRVEKAAEMAWLRHGVCVREA